MPTSSNILCRCGRFMHVEKNSVTVEELMEDGRPYKLWSADLWKCAECGASVIAGFGNRPMVEHYEEDYAVMRKSLEPVYPGRCRAKSDVARTEEEIAEQAWMMGL